MKYLRRIERTAVIWILGFAVLLTHTAALACGSMLAAAVLTYKTWTE